MKEPNDKLKTKIKNLEQQLEFLQTELNSKNKQIELLKESEEWFENIFSNSPFGVALVDSEFKIRDVNEQIVNMFGFPKEKLIGSTFQSISHPDDYLKDFRKALNVIKGDRGSYTIEKRYFNKKGEIVWGRLTASKVEDENGKFKFGIAIIEDISELRRNELILKKSEEKYRQLFENSIEGIFVVQNGYCVYSNPSTSKIIGYSKEEICSLKVLDLLYSDDKQIIQKLLDNLKKGKKFSHDIRIKRKDGKLIWLFVNYTQIEWNNMPAYLCFVNDITIRKYTEQELEESKNTLAFALEGANLAFWDQNFITGEIKRNDQWAKMLGYEPEEMSGTISDVLNIIHPDDYIKSKEISEKHKRGEIPVYKVEHRLKTKEGTWKWVLNWGKIFERNETGEPVRAIGIHMDINRQKQYEQELVKAKDAAEESDKLKSSFLANMSHEIRTPMNGIIGFSNMLLKKDLTEEKRKFYTQIIIDSSKQLLTIVNDILDISRIETEGLTINRNNVHLNEVIQEIFTFFHPIAKKNDICLYSKKGLGNDESIVLTDYVRLRQILTNLLNNAIKFTNCGQIRFGYHLNAQNIQFFVEDTGIGIAKEMQEKIFERFRQVEDHLTRKHGGTGLGLAISKKLSELLGGKLWVESELGKGSTFYFTLPYQPVKTNNTSIPCQTVLVAEDDETNLLFIEEVLQQKNINVIHAKNGFETVEYCQKNPNINLVLMDIRMPLLDGLEATKEILKFRPNLPIIAQTAYSMQEDRKKTFEAGCCDYLSKPVDKEVFMSVLGRYLNM